MAKNKNIELLEAHSFTPVIVRTADAFCVHLPEWRVTGTGATLEDAYKQYEENLKAAQTQATQFGLATWAPNPYPALTRRVIFQELALFFTKTAVGVFAVILTIILLLPNLSAAMRANLKGMIPKEIIAELKDPRYWVTQFPANMNARLDRLTPEEEANMRKDWGRLLERVSPLMSVPNEAAVASGKEKAKSKTAEKPKAD